MRFVTEQQKSVFKRCARLMIGLFGDNCHASGERAEFSVEIGSAVVEVLVLPWHDDALVMSRATVVAGADIDADLTEWLLQQNLTIDLGAFALAPNGDIVFKHAIMGASLDENELRMSVWSVMRTADDYDDVIKQRWGGKRAIDTSAEVKVTTGGNRIDGDFSDRTEAMFVDELLPGDAD